jgi:hypothetical protein
MRYDVSTPEAGLALAEIVARELQRESTAAPALSAADVLARERPSSSRARALERTLCDLAADRGWVDMPLTHGELCVAVADDIPEAFAAMQANECQMSELATRRSKALQRRAEGLIRLAGELRGDGPVIRRQAA